MKFIELGLSEQLLKSIEEVGYEEATAIQEQTIPLVLAGNDVIGQAQTGTGKTAAFGLPTIDRIDSNLRKIQALIVAPTRELAIQIQEELWSLGRSKKLKIQAVYGGSSMERQIKAIKDGPQIVVGTPGRLLDHLRRKTLKLDDLKIMILDEADEMLNMGFLPDIKAILSSVPAERQTLLFSATMPDEIKKIGVTFMKNPTHVAVKSKQLTADLIDQYYVRVRENEKFDHLTKLIDVQKPELAIVFGRTKRRVDELIKGLQMRGYEADGLHGDMNQQQRSRVLRQFKEGKIELLIATDVAARGIDVSGVSHVYNYDIPQDPESYVHRIGRTGRAGTEGNSITFVSPNEMSYLTQIEELTKTRMKGLRPPTDEEAFDAQIEGVINEIQGVFEKSDLKKYYKAAEALASEYSDLEMAALLIKQLAPSTVEVKITPERSLPDKHRRSNKSSRDGKRNQNKPKGKFSGGHVSKPSGGKPSRHRKEDHNSKDRKPKDFKPKDKAPKKKFQIK
jgi:ATP-dependent RNA helicase DeaD